MSTDRENKVAIRELFREAFDLLGGSAWLVQFASSNDGNARVFVQALSKLIPQELTGKDGSPLTIIVRKEGEAEGLVIEGAVEEQRLLQ
jgi:hypothetical protein